MQIGSDEWRSLICDGAARLGVAVSPAQVSQFGCHGQWLMEWNRKINLTAITDPAQVAVKHFLDAIAPLAYIPDKGHLLDIGTGGGFPGLPLKIMRPDQPMTLIDGVRKKINFVKHVIRQLALTHIQAHHTRAEAIGRGNEGPTGYSVVTLRAVTDLEKAILLAAPLLAPEGKIVLYQGPRQRLEIDASVSSQLHINGLDYLRESFSYRLPIIEETRFVTILKIIDTPRN